MNQFITVVTVLGMLAYFSKHISNVVFPRTSGTGDGGNDSGGRPYGIGNEGEAIKTVAGVFGDEIARWVERIYRLETANFRSGQYLKTGSAGMERHAENYPYGWTTPDKLLWSVSGFEDTRPVGFITMRENQTGRYKTFLKFASVEDGMLSLAAYIKRYRPGRWFSTNEEDAERYEEALLKQSVLYA